jgi:hypothetical protein
MVTRGEIYKQNRKHRRELGIVQTKCKFCGCYTKGKHKVWCRSDEARLIRGEILSKLNSEGKFFSSQP